VPDGHTGDSRPVPDPTALTTENLLREISHLRELTEAQLTEMDRRHEVRHIQQTDAVRNALLAVDKETSAELRRLAERVDAVERLSEAKFVTLRTLGDLQAEKVALALESADKAVSKAEAANERRFDSVNDFRGQLADQVSRFVPRTELAAQLEALAARIDAALSSISTAITDAKKRLDNAEGRSGGFASSGAVAVAVVGFVATLLSIATAIILIVN